MKEYKFRVFFESGRKSFSSDKFIVFRDFGIWCLISWQISVEIFEVGLCNHTERDRSSGKSKYVNMSYLSELMLEV